MKQNDRSAGTDGDRIILAHGGGGELTKSLIETHVISRLGNDTLNALDDSAVIDTGSTMVCMTTDSFVVQPLEFPGGDIGTLAVCGTVNDLAVMGAVPHALSLGLIVEEGLEFRVLDRILDSIAAACEDAGVRVVTGDTKVIEYGRGDGMFINTAGLGSFTGEARMSMEKITAGDVIIINGSIAEHGLAVMSVREGLTFETELKSDVASLNGLVGSLLTEGLDVKFMRDPTRGGVAGVLADVAEDTGYSIEIEEDAVPVTRVVRHTSEMLGLDPLTVANEGKVLIVAAERDGEKVLTSLRRHALGRDAAIVGRVVDRRPSLVELITRSGGRRIVQRPYGEELPRIC
jgi:hydrogenase expression/formation protein HypE